MADEKEQNQNMTRSEMEEMLSEQTTAILSAVDERMTRQDAKIDSIGTRLETIEEEVGEVRHDMEQMELRINQKIEELTTTLDKFLKRMTDMEEEFTIMKHDINRLKQVIRDKLGVDPDSLS